MARIESPLIGSGSQEEVDLRVQALLDLGTSRGYLTYEELNERLPDEVVSPDKLDSLLMMIDEMGIKLIDETDAPEHQQKIVARGKIEKLEKVSAKIEKLTKPDKHLKTAKPSDAEAVEEDDDDEALDLNLEAELAEA